MVVDEAVPYRFSCNIISEKLKFRIFSLQYTWYFHIFSSTVEEENDVAREDSTRVVNSFSKEFQTAAFIRKGENFSKKECYGEYIIIHFCAFFWGRINWQSALESFASLF
jgi:hypothetical protein